MESPIKTPDEILMVQKPDGSFERLDCISEIKPCSDVENVENDPNAKLEFAIQAVNKTLQAIADSIASAIKSIVEPFEGIDWAALAKEQRKYERRVAYHKRLSQRNQQHPKRKPRR